MTLGVLLVLGVPGLSGLPSGLAAAATPSPSPTTGGELDPLDVSPGLLGFLVTFGLVLVCIVLFVSMTRMLRRVGRRSEPENGAGSEDAPENAPAHESAPSAGGADDRSGGASPEA